MTDDDEPKDKYILDDIKLLIDQNIYKFLFILLKNIFLQTNNSSTLSYEITHKLNEQIKIINENYYKKKKEFQISTEYSKENLINILRFVKTQNKLYAAEIVENILIIIFSFAFKTKKENTFGKYIYNNLKKICDIYNNKEGFSNWFIKEKFNPQIFYELDSINEYLKNDVFIIDKLKNRLNKIQLENTLYNFLLEIYIEKYNNLKYRSNNNFLSYINKEKMNFSSEDIDNEKTTMIDKNRTVYDFSIYAINFYDEENGKTNQMNISITKAFFISVYIYYQNKHSPLMKYIKESKNKEDPTRDLAAIPFSYDLTGAVIEPNYTGIILAPIRIEPRINEIIMVQNILKEKGFIELSKILLFNKYLKIIDFHQIAIKSQEMQTLNNGLGIFDNFTLEELNLSYNYIKDDCEETLAKILSHLKGLKTLNFSSNDLKNGINSLLIVLKDLYRQKKINLENLILNKCALDDVAFYELGELLASKYCKLKNLYLNMNNIPANVCENFLKKLKKNKSLTEIYFNKCNLANRDADNIMRIMSNSNIEYLYLYKNKFTDFDDCLKILYRTKLVLSKEEKSNNIIRGNSTLYNLDLSNNDYFIKNIDQVKLIEKIIDESTLFCIDLSHILYGNDPNKILNSNERNKYQEYVLEFKKSLDEKQKEYINTVEEINSYEVDVKKLNEFKKEEFYDQIEDEIEDIIKDEKSKYPIFLKEQAKKIIIENRELFDKNKEYNNNNLKEIEKNLVDYLSLRRSKEYLLSLKEKKKVKKLIII